MNFKHIGASKKLDEILNTHIFSPMKSSLGYEGETTKQKTEDKNTVNFTKVFIEDNDNN